MSAVRDVLRLYWAAMAVLLARLASLPLYPLTDTTEARYALVARTMADSGDWITPWFAPGVPFWAKPPLSFWAGAAMIQAFGFSEWAVRLGTFLPAAASVALVAVWARRRWPGEPRVSALAALVLASCTLLFVSSGSVLTDTWLMLGTTLAMLGLDRELDPSQRSGQGWAMAWGGVAIGLLAKGPLVLVLLAVPFLACAARRGRLWAELRGLRHWLGVLASLAMAAPWYGAAEAHTPGFLHYFLVGEHWLRFLQPGWDGDRYGSAHQKPLGTIWLYLLSAALPWTLLLPLAARRWWGSPQRKQDGELLIWALWPAVFFTTAGNILPTYLLPAMPPLALWLARYGLPQTARRLPWLGGVLPLLMVVALAAWAAGAFPLRSSRELVAAWQQAGGRAGQAPLHYLFRVPFSARLYAGEGAAQAANPETLAALPPGAFIVSRGSTPPAADLERRFEDGRQTLWQKPAH